MKVYKVTIKPIEAHENVEIWIATDHKGKELSISVVPGSDLRPTIREIDVSVDAPGIDLIVH